MDFKALMTKLEIIDKKQILTESEDRKPAKQKERDVTLPSGAKVKARTVQGWQSQKADKEADKESKKTDEGIVFKSGIAQELLREFNLFEADFQFSPEQLKWLGGADKQDPFILARMPGPKPPLSYFTDPESKQIAQQRFAKVFVDAPAGGQGASPAKPAAPQASVQTDDEGNTLTTTASGATSVVGPDGKPLPNGGRVQAAPAAGGSFDSMGNPVAAGSAAATNADPTGLAQAQQDVNASQAATKPAGGAAASPAKPGADGAVGQDLAKMGVSKKDRLDQAFVDKTLGPGYKAGSAEANLALQAHMKKQGGAAAGGQAASPAGGAASPAGGQAASPAGGAAPDAGTANLAGQKPGLDASGRMNAASDPRVAGNAQQQAASPAAAPAAGGTTPGQNARDDLLARQSKPAGGQAASPAGTSTAGAGRGGQGGPTAQELATANAPKPANPLSAAKAGQAASPAPAASAPAAGGKTTTTTTNTSVSGTMKMGKPDGPIQYNGKTVNPGDPDYAAASQALIAQSQKAQAGRRQASAPGAPGVVSQGVANADRADFESVQSLDDAILERIKAFKF